MKSKENKNKNKSKKNKSLPKTILDIIPVRFYDDAADAIVLKDDTYMDILEIIPQDRNSLHEDEIKIEMFSLAKFYKLYAPDCKIISLNFPVDTTFQQEILQRKIKRTTDIVRKEWLDREIDELIRLDENVHRKEFFFIFYGNNSDNLSQNREDILEKLGSRKYRLVREIDKAKKLQILRKINNMNSLISGDATEEIDEINDEELIRYIQPAGGISFKDIKDSIFGDGYVRSICIYGLPKTLEDFWLDKVFGKEGIATMDIHTRDLLEVKKNINKSMKEEISRERSAKDYGEYYDAKQRQEQLQIMLDELSSMGEVVKMVKLRIFIAKRTFAEIETETENIMGLLSGDNYESTVLLNENKSEWESLYEAYGKQQDKMFFMKGHPLMTEQLAFGYPFNYSELFDKYGTLLGFTPIGGVVLFDEFEKTKSRQYYNSLVTGGMGSGKSTLLKKRFKANAAAGNFVRTFDVSGEFQNLTLEFGGKIIKCNGRDGILNPLEILKAGEDDFTSYTRHISKVSTFYKCIMPGATEQELLQLENYLRDFYEQFELTPKDGRDITGLASKRYPILSDFLNFIENKIEVSKKEKAESTAEKELLKIEIGNLASIHTTIKNITQNYGSMFDGHTSVDNITDEKIVTFDISDIKDLGNVFVAQMFNMVSLCWDNAINNGSIMKSMWESGEIETEDVTAFLILIDESHRWINTSMPMILDLIIKYQREARKYFAGITLASQSIRDYMPEGNNSPHVDQIRTLFELTQYKFIFKQDSSALPLIRTVFSNLLTYSQVEQIPYLESGETILAISGDKSIKFTVWLSKTYEEQLFAGGR